MRTIQQQQQLQQKNGKKKFLACVQNAKKNKMKLYNKKYLLINIKTFLFFSYLNKQYENYFPFIFFSFFRSIIIFVYLVIDITKDGRKKTFLCSIS